MTKLESAQLLAELEPTVEENLNRHLATAKEWMPHEYVPWSQGRDFADLGGEPWEVEQSTLSPIARTALEVNLLTEDNLPSYHREVERAFGRDSAWGTWVNRWTAEEGRHAFCIRDYLLVTRGVDPDELERARMETMETGYDAGDKPLLQRLRLRLVPGARHPGLAPQHRPLHRGADRREAAHPGREGREPAHDLLPQHRRRPRSSSRPSQTMRAITDEVVGFQMPGSIIPGFARKAVQMAKAGIYDLRIHHDDIVMPAAAAVGRLRARGARRRGRAGARGARRRGQRPGRRGHPVRRAPRRGGRQEGGAPVGGYRLKPAVATGRVTLCLCGFRGGCRLGQVTSGNAGVRPRRGGIPWGPGTTPPCRWRGAWCPTPVR